MARNKIIFGNEVLQHKAGSDARTQDHELADTVEDHGHDGCGEQGQHHVTHQAFGAYRSVDVRGR